MLVRYNFKLKAYLKVTPDFLISITVYKVYNCLQYYMDISLNVKSYNSIFCIIIKF